MTEPSPVRAMVAEGNFDMIVLVTSEGVYLDVNKETLSPVQMVAVLMEIAANIMRDEGVSSDDLANTDLSLNEVRRETYEG